MGHNKGFFEQNIVDMKIGNTRSFQVHQIDLFYILIFSTKCRDCVFSQDKEVVESMKRKLREEHELWNMRKTEYLCTL